MRKIAYQLSKGKHLDVRDEIVLQTLWIRNWSSSCQKFTPLKINASFGWFSSIPNQPAQKPCVSVQEGHIFGCKRRNSPTHLVNSIIVDHHGFAASFAITAESALNPPLISSSCELFCCKKKKKSFRAWCRPVCIPIHHRHFPMILLDISSTFSYDF